jgi:alkanesulfonate monooxygenase SsuD/methylene tetrahydromethanopterin reductase-like flavin-dependent oxidoreductase (luciferase family)
MMRLAAEFADAWNSDWAKNPAEVTPLLAELEAACLEIGRDPETLVRTAGSNVAMPGYLGVRPNPIMGTNEQMAEVIAGFRELGFKHWVAELDPCTSTSLEQFAQVIEILDRSSK